MSKENAINRKVVLVVEDEFFVREDAVWVLEDHGFEALQAVTAEQGLKVLERRPDISVIFADIHLPGALDGLDLARIVAEERPELPVVVTSGRTRMLDEQVDFVRQFIPKPYAPEMVARQLAALVEARESQNGVRDRTAAASVPSSR